jgi:hypothetical protein
MAETREAINRTMHEAINRTMHEAIHRQERQGRVRRAAGQCPSGQGKTTKKRPGNQGATPSFRSAESAYSAGLTSEEQLTGDCIFVVIFLFFLLLLVIRTILESPGGRSCNISGSTIMIAGLPSIMSQGKKKKKGHPVARICV